MSDWEELCEMKGLDNDDEATDKLIDLIHSSEGTINSDQQKTKLYIKKSAKVEDVGGTSCDEDIPL
ncbi:hypothetical protein SAMN06297280_3427 [Arsukibacterium tuosuense]|uniref:Uncharacterized protein n=1 Tax=Arsukibacterium tuosuense TaxID=1323745 RepID=A0A285JE33_9GAMM|nr:hypothetical protein [Arsukibacterium tuosuense]SNY58524.1 hypothetical protein SAMN06297280_3427 [Arsukibacterium tuosuense]